MTQTNSERMREISKEWEEISDESQSYGIEYDQFEIFLKSEKNKVFHTYPYPESAFELDAERVGKWWLSKFADIKASLIAELEKEKFLMLSNKNEVQSNRHRAFYNKAIDDSISLVEKTF